MHAIQLCTLYRQTCKTYIHACQIHTQSISTCTHTHSKYTNYNMRLDTHSPVGSYFTTRATFPLRGTPWIYRLCSLHSLRLSGPQPQVLPPVGWDYLGPGPSRTRPVKLLPISLRQRSEVIFKKHYYSLRSQICCLATIRINTEMTPIEIWHLIVWW